MVLAHARTTRTYSLDEICNLVAAGVIRSRARCRCRKDCLLNERFRIPVSLVNRNIRTSIRGLARFSTSGGRGGRLGVRGLGRW